MKGHARARLLALTRCSTAHVYASSDGHMRAFSLARVVGACARTGTAANMHTYMHICTHAYRYMIRATDTCKRSSYLSFSPFPPLSHTHTHTLSLSFLSHSFRFRPLPLNRAFFLFRSYPCAFSQSILLYPTSRSPPLSTPSRILYSFSLSLLFAPSPPLCLRLTLRAPFPPSPISPKLLPLSLATAYTADGSRTGSRRPPVSAVDVP